jgi:hypothetical protein
MVMRTGFPLYEDDSFIRLDGLLPGSERVGTAPTPSRRSLPALIGDTVRDLFRRLEASAQRMRYRELEEYLADSGDVFELERRMRGIERRYGAGFNSFF